MSHHGCNRQSSSPGRCPFKPEPRCHGSHHQHHQGPPHFLRGGHHGPHFNRGGHQGHFNPYSHGSRHEHGPRHEHRNFERPNFNRCMFGDFQDQGHQCCVHRAPRPDCHRGHAERFQPPCGRKFGDHSSSDQCRFRKERSFERPRRRHSVDVATTEKETCDLQE